VFTGSTAAHVGVIDKSSSTPGGCSVADNKTNMVNVILTRVLNHKILYTTVLARVRGGLATTRPVAPEIAPSHSNL
jgi:hypothetical protein